MPLLKDRLMTHDEIRAALGVIGDRLACIDPAADTPPLTQMLLASLTEITRLVQDMNVNMKADALALDALMSQVAEMKK
jgi:hypothetical protein